MRAHALAPDRHRGLDLLGLELGQRGHRVGRVHDHLVRAARRAAGEQVGLAAAAGERVRRPRPPPPSATAPGRGSARRAPSSRRSRAARRPRAACGPRGRPRTGRSRGRSAGAAPRRGRRPGASRARPRRSRAGPVSGSMRSSGKALLHGHVLDALLHEGRPVLPRSRRARRAPARRSGRAARSTPAPALARHAVGLARGSRRPRPSPRRSRSTASRPSRATWPRNSSRQVPITTPSSTATMCVASGSRPSWSASSDTPCSPQNTRSRSASAAATRRSVRASRTSTVSERSGRCPPPARPRSGSRPGARRRARPSSRRTRCSGRPGPR